MNKIVTQAEYDSASPELQRCIDEIRIMYAVYILKEFQERGHSCTIEEMIGSVITLHQTGYLTLVSGEDGGVYFVTGLPCDDGVHTEPCDTAEEIIQSTKEVEARWGAMVEDDADAKVVPSTSSGPTSEASAGG